MASITDYQASAVRR